MATSHPHFCDAEGFFNLALRHRIKLCSVEHEFYFPEDVIRNEYSLQEQETKKEKWRVYSKVLSFINCFDKNYSLLSNIVDITDKMNKLMSTFPEIMEVMNKKKQHLIDSFPDKARETMRRLGFTPSIGTSPLIIQNKSRYTVI